MHADTLETIALAAPIRAQVAALLSSPSPSSASEALIAALRALRAETPEETVLDFLQDCAGCLTEARAVLEAVGASGQGTVGSISSSSVALIDLTRCLEVAAAGERAMGPIMALRETSEGVVEDGDEAQTPDFSLVKFAFVSSQLDALQVCRVCIISMPVTRLIYRNDKS